MSTTTSASVLEVSGAPSSTIRPVLRVGIPPVFLGGFRAAATHFWPGGCFFSSLGLRLLIFRGGVETVQTPRDNSPKAGYLSEVLGTAAEQREGQLDRG